MSTSNFPFVFRAVDTIPQSESGETGQNSEPSIAVNPLNPMQMFAGLFGAGGVANPYFVSTDGGATWSIFGTVAHGDTTSSWKVDASAVLVATLAAAPPGAIDTRSVTVPG